MIETLPALWIVFAAFLFAGTVKGISGVGLPLTALGILTFFTDPRSAFACALVPIFLSNALQLYRIGNIGPAIRRYLPYLITMAVLIPIVLTMTAEASQEFLFLTLGIVILIFVTLNLTKWAPRLPDHHDRKAQVIAGGMAGVLGGLTSIWLPVVVTYLTARNTPKDEFIRASGLMLMVGSVPLFLGYVSEGFLTGPVALLSLALVIPTGFGMLAGEHLRVRLSEAGFRKAVLFIFLLIGLNLIRRGAFG